MHLLTLLDLMARNLGQACALETVFFAVAIWPVTGQGFQNFPQNHSLKSFADRLWPPFLGGQYFQSAATVRPQTSLNFSTQCVLNLWARKHAKMQRSCPLRYRLNVNLTKFDVRDFYTLIPEAWKRFPFRAEPQRIGHYSAYPRASNTGQFH